MRGSCRAAKRLCSLLRRFSLLADERAPFGGEDAVYHADDLVEVGRLDRVLSADIIGRHPMEHFPYLWGELIFKERKKNDNTQIILEL